MFATSGKTKVARKMRPIPRATSDLTRVMWPKTPTQPEIVLLGSIATGKYVDVLLEALGDRLVFPIDFLGRGDMSRGGLLLRRARAGRELRYTSVEGAVRNGRRPPKLAPLRRKAPAAPGGAP
jgi:hypothetical protein